MRTLLLLILVVALLAISNPDRDDFAEFAREQTAELVAQQGGGGLLSGTLGRIGGDLVGSQASRFVSRDNYLVASVYTLDLDGPNSDRQDWRFLGVAGQFVELSRPAALER
jgi:hypothetical protein